MRNIQKAISKMKQNLPANSPLYRTLCEFELDAVSDVETWQALSDLIFMEIGEYDKKSTDADVAILSELSGFNEYDFVGKK